MVACVICLYRRPRGWWQSQFRASEPFPTNRTPDISTWWWPAQKMSVEDAENLSSYGLWCCQTLAYVCSIPFRALTREERTNWSYFSPKNTQWHRPKCASWLKYITQTSTSLAGYVSTFWKVGTEWGTCFPTPKYVYTVHECKFFVSISVFGMYCFACFVVSMYRNFRV